MPDVTLIIDGVQVKVPAGTVIVEAARTAGIGIPVFCYHPKLAPVGMCRMCVVEVGTPKLGPDRKPELDAEGKAVIARMPKLQPACTTPVSDGMVVWTESEEVKFAQSGVLEMLLTSHPLDCPVCDKGGECPLQNLTMQWGPGRSRFEYNDKLHFEKPIPLGDLIYLDRERCILCARCVRFQDEIAGDPVLGFDQRGRAWQIISKSNPTFDSKFSGNTTDICPVGALTSADFRFKARVWEVKPSPTVCPHCPVGCNMTLDMRHEDVKRVMPAENELVNEIWICDRGRYGRHFITSKERLTTPLIRRSGGLQPATWEEALSHIAQRLGDIRKSGKALGGIAGPRLPNEDLYVFQKFMREVLGSNNVDHREGGPFDLPFDDLGATLGLASGTNLGELGKGTLVLVVGADPEEEAPVHLLRLKGIANRGGVLATLNVRTTKLDRFASLVARPRVGAEAQVLALLVQQIQEKFPGGIRLNGLEELKGSVRGLKLEDVAATSGVDVATLSALASAIGGAENLVIVYGRDARAAGEPVLAALGNLLLLSGKAGKQGSGLLPILEANNSRGALDMGVRPDRGPGYVALSKAGMTSRQMLEAARAGTLAGLYVAGSDPARQSAAAAEALNAVGFLVVQDIFLTATAKLADVVLPAASFAEREGTFTNAERRVQRFRQARSAEGQSRPDWQILQALAQELNSAPAAAPAGDEQSRRKQKAQQAAVQAGTASTWRYSSPAEIMLEISKTVPIYNGITYSKIALAKGTMEAVKASNMPSFQESFGQQEVQYSRGAGGDLRWDRQQNDPLYFDGTAYKNMGGYGIQWPVAAERGTVGLAVQPLTPGKPAERSATRPFALLPITRLYDGDVLLQDSDLLENRLARAEVLINRADALRFGITTGTTVRLTSTRGSLVVPARVSKEPAEGTLLIPLDLSDAPLGELADGHVTAVALEKVEG
jgi:NADH-quinone oxidoreductase subunit G